MGVSICICSQTVTDESQRDEGGSLFRGVSEDLLGQHNGSLHCVNLERGLGITHIKTRMKVMNLKFSPN